jgi:hypothetical protein
MGKKLRILLVALLIVICGIASVRASDGIAVDAWVRSKGNQENKLDTATFDEQISIIQEQLREGQLKLYYSKESSVVGTRDLVLTPPAVATEAVDIEVLDDVDRVYTVPHISPEGVPGLTTLSEGEIAYTRFFSTDEPLTRNKVVVYTPELWLVDADGTSNPTFVATGTSCSIVGEDIGICTGKFQIPADTATGGTDRRLSIIPYFRRSENVGSANPTVTAWCGGQYAGIVTAQLPSEVVMLTDGSNASNIITSSDSVNEAIAFNSIYGKVTKSSKDANDIFTVVDYYDSSDVLRLKSTLSGGTSPEYTTRTVITYDNTGATTTTRVYTQSYDVDGLWTGEED